MVFCKRQRRIQLRQAVQKIIQQNLKMVFFRIIALITSKPFRKIAMKMLFSVLCCDSQHFFFRGSPTKHTQLSKLVIRNKLILKELFGRIIVVILEANSKENSEDVFSPFLASTVNIQANTLSYQNFQFKVRFILKWYFAESLH